MELHNETIIFTRREKRALGLARRAMPVLGLEQLWQDIQEANDERMSQLGSSGLRFPRVWQILQVLDPRGACYLPAYNQARFTLREHHAMQSLQHCVQAIIQETLPVIVEQPQPPDVQDI